MSVIFACWLFILKAFHFNLVFALSCIGNKPPQACMVVGCNVKGHLEILCNLTNPMKTSKLLKCFQISVPYASDV